MQSIKEKMLAHADMKDLSQKREAFSLLMDKVNRVLQSALLPDMAGCPEAALVAPAANCCNSFRRYRWQSLAL